MHVLKPFANRKNVGEWHLVREYDTEVETQRAAGFIREGNKPGVPAGDWDAYAQGNLLWVCYYGEGPNR